jgi:hypothetical protein
MLRLRRLWIKLQLASAGTFARDVAEKSQIVPGSSPLMFWNAQLP